MTDFGFVAPAGAADLDPFEELLRGTGDDSDAAEFDAADLGTLEEEFARLRELRLRRDRLAEGAKEAAREYEDQRQRMVTAMDAQGTRQYGGAAGEGGCSVVEEYQTTVEDPTTFMEWVHEHHPELLSVNAQTRTAFVRREYRDKGVPPEEMPPGLVARTRRTLTVRGMKPRETQGD